MYIDIKKALGEDITPAIITSGDFFSWTAFTPTQSAIKVHRSTYSFLRCLGSEVLERNSKLPR